ncbi:hypothetical protein KFK09_007957 [Dendrobium nobile]|uniref:Uncharacterized protein n=1 Tax=Dendrobium nobile TaxID=94219 RepID=A0A8T3BXY6_DENNO|nr:hypothetical protein KFK09_007957 [Dendrobium nobile]
MRKFMYRIPNRASATKNCNEILYIILRLTLNISGKKKTAVELRIIPSKFTKSVDEKNSQTHKAVLGNISKCIALQIECVKIASLKVRKKPLITVIECRI